MNRSFKKILISGTSLLMLIGVGASTSQMSNPIHASRISRLRARRSRDYRDIKSINAELNKLEHKTFKYHAKKHVKTHHESVATYYKNHAKSWHWNNMSNTAFRNGYENGDGENYSMGYPLLNRKFMHNTQYKHGWVISYAKQYGHSRYRGYANGLRQYKDGVAYLQSNSDEKLAGYQDYSDSWVSE